MMVTKMTTNKHSIPYDNNIRTDHHHHDNNNVNTRDNNTDKALEISHVDLHYKRVIETCSLTGTVEMNWRARQ